MVEVIYIGRMGNRLFQYCFGRILAESLKWQLRCKPLYAFPGTAKQISGHHFDTPEIRYIRNATVDIAKILDDPTPRKIVIKAWMQKYEYYRPYAAQIRRWLMPRSIPTKACPTPDADDVVLHFRLGSDYEKRRWILHPEFYWQVLDTIEPWKKLYICYDIRQRVSKGILDKCISPFLRYEPIVFASGRPLLDFHFVRQFRRIAIAPSTFCWWSAYLSDAREIYFPDLRQSYSSCWRERPTQFIRLEVDEPRYKYFHARTLWD